MTTLTVPSDRAPDDQLVVELESGALTFRADCMQSEPVEVTVSHRRSIQELRDLLDQHLAATTCSACDGTGHVDDLIDSTTPCPDCLPAMGAQLAVDEMVRRFALFSHPEVGWRELFAQMYDCGYRKP